jgi:hypothetical protein
MNVRYTESREWLKIVIRPRPGIIGAIGRFIQVDKLGWVYSAYIEKGLTNDISLHQLPGWVYARAKQGAARRRGNDIT